MIGQGKGDCVYWSCPTLANAPAREEDTPRHPPFPLPPPPPPPRSPRCFHPAKRRSTHALRKKTVEGCCTSSSWSCIRGTSVEATLTMQLKEPGREWKLLNSCIGRVEKERGFGRMKIREKELCGIFLLLSDLTERGWKPLRMSIMLIFWHWNDLLQIVSC